MPRIVAGLYDSYQDAASAVRDLETAGVLHEDISLLANRVLSDNASSRYVPGESDGNEAATGAGAGAAFGAILGGGTGFMVSLGMIMIPGIGQIAAAGWLVATLVGAAAGALVAGAGGGLIGAMVGNGIDFDDAQVYAEGVRRGGSLLLVRAADGFETIIEPILLRHNMVDLGARRLVYRQAGWTAFDETAPAYTEEEPGEHSPRPTAGPLSVPRA
jgi:hypothetical protein